MSLNVPLAHATEIKEVLEAVKATGNKVSEELAQQLASSWGFMCANVGEHNEPVIFLPRRSSSESICVAAWLTCECCLDVAEQPESMDKTSVEGWPRVGDRAEVRFGERWYVGDVVKRDAHGMTTMHCDVDPSNVLVQAHISTLRRPTQPLARGASKDDLCLDKAASRDDASKTGTPLSGPRLSGH